MVFLFFVWIPTFVGMTSAICKDSSNFFHVRMDGFVSCGVTHIHPKKVFRPLLHCSSQQFLFFLYQNKKVFIYFDVCTQKIVGFSYVTKMFVYKKRPNVRKLFPKRHVNKFIRPFTPQNTQKHFAWMDARKKLLPSIPFTPFPVDVLALLREVAANHRSRAARGGGLYRCRPFRIFFSRHLSRTAVPLRGWR